MLVIGILIGVIVGLFFLARIIAIDTQGEFVSEDPRVIAEIDQRIAPVGRVLLQGDEQLAAAQEAATAAPAPVDMPLTGPQVFNQACYLCHADPGVGGAPVIGDAAAWSSRIEQGMDTLIEHALNGFQGNTGFMPAKGGRVDLSDEEVIEAVQYMVEQVEGAE
ncbi:MAG: cytochrome c5 family protein [Gammaproteobacteria bacterium]|nr:cytochrome c5 family protein [Gammaproteobacteria bacterium]